MTTRMYAVTVASEDDDNDENIREDVPVDMKAFKDELDQITHSNFDELFRRAKTSTSSKHIGKPPSPERLIDKNEAHYSSSPVPDRRKDRLRTPQTVPTASYRSRSTQREPSPIQTPAYQLFSTSSPEEYHRRNGDRTEDNGILGQQSTWMALVDAMRDTLDRQDALIRHLQRDNEVLRAEMQELKRQQRQPERVDEPPNPRPVMSQLSPRRPRPVEAPEYPRPVVTQSTPPRPVDASTHPRPAVAQSTPPRPVRPPVSWQYAGYRDDDPILLRRAGFSPGTQFVAELAQVIDLEPSHQAPLSVIIDKHWDRVSKIRQKNGWNR